MKNEIIAILDRSYSMTDMGDEPIGGFNSFVEEQKKLPGKASISLVLFDHLYELIYQGKNLSKAPKLTKKIYTPRGTTALLDAVGRTIVSQAERFKKMRKAIKPESVIVVIITDGMENASSDFTKAKVKELVEKYEKENWNFIFLGANMDAFAEGYQLGFKSANTNNWVATPKGMRSAYTQASCLTTSYRV